MKLDFANATLYASIRSPFARRVRLTLLEHEVPYEERMLDPWQPQPELFALNPLNRVPTLRLASGETLIESTLILSAFYDSIRAAGGESPWLPESTAERLEIYRVSALAIGLIEKSIEQFLETQRAPEKRDPAIFTESQGLFGRTFDWLEHRLAEAGGRAWIVGKGPTQADLDLGAALDYFSFRVNADWGGRHPRLAAYAEALGRRPAFARTRPE